MASLLQLLEAEGKGFAGEIGARTRDLHQRELERQTWIAALSHVLDRDGEQIDQPDHGRLAELVRLRTQPFARLLRHGQGVGHLAHVLDEHQMAQVLEQVDYETPEVLALLGKLLDEGQRAGGVAIDDEIAETKERLLLHRAEELQHGLHGHFVLSRRSELVERRHRVAVRATCAAGDQRERLVRRVDPFAVGDATEHAHQLGETRPLEDERLTPRPNGGQDLREIGRAEHEYEMRGRLLDQLQERVPRGVGELMRLVEDVDLVPPLRGLQDDALADLSDVVDPTLRRRVHFDDVERRAARDRHARVAHLVGSGRRPLNAVQPFREDPREGRLPGAAGPGEQVGLTDLSGGDRIPERADDRLLPDDLVEVLRSVLPVERGHLVDLTGGSGLSRPTCLTGLIRLIWLVRSDRSSWSDQVLTRG